MTELVIGVDVSKDWIDVFDPSHGQNRLDNAPPALKRFARSAARRDAFVVFEATGGYDAALRHALEQAQARFHRANPKRARDFSRAVGVLAKTDRVDARQLGEMGRRLDLRPCEPVAPERRRLQALTARRRQLVETRKQERTRLQQTGDPAMRRSVERHLRWLDREVAKLEADMAGLAETGALAEMERRLRSAPGVGPVVAATILAEAPELGRLDRRRMAALAGLAPFPDDTGQRAGIRRIAGGRKVLRSALYMAALVASRSDPELTAARAAIEARGAKPKQAIIAIARKLLTRLNAMLRDGVEYAPPGRASAQEASV